MNQVHPKYFGDCCVSLECSNRFEQKCGLPKLTVRFSALSKLESDFRNKI